MLKGILQSDSRLLNVIRDYGCYFLCLAESSPIVFDGDAGCQRLNGIWTKATELKIISGDLNLDGDFDDSGEAEIQNATELAQMFFSLNVRYDGVHHSPEEEIPLRTKVIIGQYYYRGSHFVLLDRQKKVIFDSFGKSNTVQNGYLKSMRWFY